MNSQQRTQLLRFLLSIGRPEESERAGRGVGHGPVRLLAGRLQRTLRPGQKALEALASRVPRAEQIERDAMRNSDSLFPKDHPNAGKTVRERIELILNAAGEHNAA